MPPSQSPRCRSRRTSQAAYPPAIHHSSGGDYAGPLRHPKPLTPADLHLALEQEQESMVNRLTRELSALRQQTASVASTTSSTSAINDSTDALHSLHSPAYVPTSNSSHHPTPHNRHRSSSSLSSYIPAVQGSRTGHAPPGVGVAPSRDSGIPSSRSLMDVPVPRQGRSRAPSATAATSPRPSEESSHPSVRPGSLVQQGDHLPQPPRSHRSSFRMTSPVSSSYRSEDAVHYRAEVESLKRENESLRKKVKELEQAFKERREQGATSTTAEEKPAPAAEEASTSTA